MAISNTDVKVNSTLRSQLDSSMSAASYSQAVGGNVGEGFSSLQNRKAGIKVGFFTALDEALTAYETELVSIINELETNPNIAQAFKGEGIVTAVKNLIVAVKDEANRYISAMKAAEKQIIESVVEAYKAQDAKLGETMNADTSNLSSGSDTAS